MELSVSQNIPLTYLNRSKRVEETVPPGSIDSVKKKPTIAGSRVLYTKKFRQERNLLSVMENTFSTKLSYPEYRANRFMYYRGIPALKRLLTFSVDQRRLQMLEWTLYEQLLSYQFKRALLREESGIPPQPGETRFRKPNRLWIMFRTDPDYRL